jgi:ribosomal protein S18 acetylase RimI-like enzyme
MLAAPVTTAARSSTGPRPINLTKDTRQVLRLLDVAFGHVQGSQGQRILYNRLSLSHTNPLALRLNMVTRGFHPGFVWDEDGKIIGNVTLLTSEVPGRYLIANLAVLPEYRRRGIARALMQEALEHIINLQGRNILLQVESDYEPALSLYQSMGFNHLGTMKRWHTTPSRLRTLPKNIGDDPQIRSLGRNDWRAAINLDRASVHPDLNWPVPPPNDLYKMGFWRRLSDFLNGRRMDAWISDTISVSDGRRRLTGLVSISGEWGRPTWLRIRIDPTWRGKVERPLLYKALLRLKQLRGGTINMNHPAGDEMVNQLISDANFRIQRNLTIMTLDMVSKG